MSDEVRTLWKGSSAGPKASLDEALKNAVAELARANPVNHLSWRVRDVRGYHGGVVGIGFEVLIEMSSSESQRGLAKGPRPVSQIKRLDLHWIDRTNVEIKALGTVTTSGWTNPALSRRIYVRPPPDGFWEFDFVATEPTGPSNDVLEALDTKTEWQVPYGGSPPPRGIRVCGERNAMERLFTEAELKRISAATASDAGQPP